MIGYCQRCGKRPRGKMQQANWEMYQPFCSYQCKVDWDLDSAREYLRERREQQGAS